MNINRKELDSAIATKLSLKQQHTTAEANKDTVFARRGVLMEALKVAAENLESAQIRNMRGLVSDDEVETLRTEYQTVRDALVKQNEDEEMALRAMNMSLENAVADEALVFARSNYFGAVSERIEKSLRADAKLRRRLIDDLVAHRSMLGRDPDLASGLGGGCGGAQWGEVLLACFPLPTSEELLRGASRFAAEYGSHV